MSSDIAIFKPEFYAGIEERINKLSEIEEALRLIKKDRQLQDILRAYSLSSHYKGLDLYRKKYRVPRKMEEGKVLEVRLSLSLANPLEFTFDSEKLCWWGDKKWFTTDQNWAVFYGGPDTGAGWYTDVEQYIIEEERNGVFVLKSVAEQDSNNRGDYHRKRISEVEALKCVTKDEILSNLERELQKI
jgi:hypothetical protein